MPNSSRPPTQPASAPPATALGAGLAYLSRCLRGRRSFAVVTAIEAASVSRMLDAFMADQDFASGVHRVRVAEPTDDVGDFLRRVLTQLGFESVQAGPEDLQRFLVVFLRHEVAQGRRTAICLERTEKFGPRVLASLQTLAATWLGGVPALTLVLTGGPTLHRVLDSLGMTAAAPLTRERFDLDRGVDRVARIYSAAPVTKRQTPAADATLVVVKEGEIIKRHRVSPGRRVLIGRGPHNDLCLPGNFVSRHHAVVMIGEHSAKVIDLRSTNGTRVNDRDVRQHVLVNNDIVGIGKYDLRFEWTGGISAATSRVTEFTGAETTVLSERDRDSRPVPRR